MLLQTLLLTLYFGEFVLQEVVWKPRGRQFTERLRSRLENWEVLLILNQIFCAPTTHSMVRIISKLTVNTVTRVCGTTM